MKFILASSCIVLPFIISLASSQKLDNDIEQVLKNLTARENEIYGPTLFGTTDITLEDLTDDLDTWEPPKWMSEMYPYYLAGYDYDNRPIWVVEMGKYQMRKLIDKGPEAAATFTKYCLKATKIIIKSHGDRDPENKQASFLLDFDGLKFEQYAHVPTTAYILRLARQFRKLLIDYTEVAVVVNANFVTETLINILKPALGEVLKFVELYGTNRAQWVPRVLRHFPPESLPEWYGGNRKDYAPILVRG